MKRSLGAYITHAAVALYLLTGGILALADRTLGQRLGLAVGIRNAAKNDIVDTLNQVFGAGDLAKTLTVLFAVLAIAGGVFLLFELFGVKVPIVDIIILVFLIVWLVFIVLSDVVYAFKDARNFVFLLWLRTLASHLVVLGTLISASRKFGD
jgi:hypothetical protein